MNCKGCKKSFNIGDEVVTMEISLYYPPDMIDCDDNNRTDLHFMDLCPACADRQNDRQSRIDNDTPRSDGVENTRMRQELIAITEVSRTIYK